VISEFRRDGNLIIQTLKKLEDFWSQDTISVKIGVGAERPEGDTEWCSYYDVWVATDENGMFALNGIPAGMPVVIYVDGLWDGFESGYWTGDDFSEICSEAEIFTSGGAEARRANIVLEEASHISGRVMDMHENPQAWSYVQVYDSESYEMLGSGSTDDMGYYAFYFKNAPSGRIKVSAQGQWGSGLIPGFYNGKSDFETADEITAPSEAYIDGINFYLPRGAVITGFANYADRFPAAGVNVDVYDAEFLNWMTSAVTDASGRYEANGLPVGDYIVRFSNYIVHGVWTYSYYNNVKSYQEATPVSLTSGEVYQGIDMTVPHPLCDLDGSGEFDSHDADMFASDFGNTWNAASDFDHDYDIDGMDLYRMLLSLGAVQK